MLSDAPTILKSLFELIEIVKKEKLKSIITILILLTILLVKPTIYYSTLYVTFCEFLNKAMFVLLIFFIIYKIYRYKTKSDYDKNTINYLIAIYTIFTLFLFYNSIKYNHIWSDIFSIETINKTDFIKSIHLTEYNNGFYNYVFSNFPVVLLYSIEFVQSLSITYLNMYVLSKLLFNEKPLMNGFCLEDWGIILSNSLIIIISSPVLYTQYLNFWNHIF